MTSFRPSVQSVELDRSGHATLGWCSWRDAGWRSTLLRQFDARDVVDEARLPALDDQVLVLVTAGQADVEASSDGRRWRRSRHVPGRLAMTAPGRAVWMRWTTTSTGALQTMQLHIPGRALQEVSEQVWGRDLGVGDLPDTLATTDPLVETTLLALVQACRAGAGELYAQSALQFLAVHLLMRPGMAPSAPPTGHRPDRRIVRTVTYMQDNLALPMSLDELAAVAQLSPFYFLRLFRGTLGEPPHRYLTRLRIAAARRRLERGDLSVSDVGYLCGFSSPAHFAAAFRRWTGSSPSTYRDSVRRP